MLNNVTLWLIG